MSKLINRKEEIMCNIFGNISEIQVLNEKAYSQLHKKDYENDSVKKILENIQIQLEMQENLMRLAVEIDVSMDEFEEI